MRRPTRRSGARRCWTRRSRSPPRPATTSSPRPRPSASSSRRAPEWVVLGAFEPAGGLVGTVGLFRDLHVKSAHKAHLWGMYVTPSQRRHGVAAELLEAALRHARSLPGVGWVHLGVSAAAPGARRLYERAGFEVWGTEPEALRHEGQAVVEHHMALRVG